MEISKEEIEKILYEEGKLSLDTLMEKLSISRTNSHRLQLTSFIKWDSNIERTYIRQEGTPKTFYYLKGI
ncbi:hypothetical protein CUM48_04310 [Enterococcus faecalis]|uniref:hypothetical protein n=1 Tax=Enterococcus faecalis TaxID=1351 RepID=UPI000CF2172B|nr:hypothetical protein [Enterococcus faecalis]EHR4923828.1 hypothetical protein [Enterococcus faecalis]EIQ7117399.1 hypothetical protein [Enterococcus faecalis]PQD81477.1 hypothetical protein CUM48_04310 [Enterococcus faecalis]